MNDAAVIRSVLALGARRQRRVLRRVAIVLLVSAGTTAAVWAARRPILRAVGQMLVAEDEIAAADMVIVSVSDIQADALEAADLYHCGLAGSVVLPTIRNLAIDDEIRALGVPYPNPTSLAAAILEYAGVPNSAIHLLPDPVDGTDTEAAAVGAFVRQQMPRTVLFITARTHTARARWLLRRELPAQVELAVHSPAADVFATDGWWRRRDEAREVVVEYVRWVNSLILGDPWGRRSSARTAG